jgi:hypothetical protein
MAELCCAAAGTSAIFIAPVSLQVSGLNDEIPPAIQPGHMIE